MLNPELTSVTRVLSTRRPQRHVADDAAATLGVQQLEVSLVHHGRVVRRLHARHQVHRHLLPHGLVGRVEEDDAVLVGLRRRRRRSAVEEVRGDVEEVLRESDALPSVQNECFFLPNIFYLAFGKELLCRVLKNTRQTT
jgi:hypothetical protein